MNDTTVSACADTRPDRRRAGITPRGTAALAILRAQDLVRDLDAADCAYLAPYAAELLTVMSGAVWWTAAPIDTDDD